MLLSYVGTNKNLEAAYLAGKVCIELSPQGTIAERLRCAGAGMPGFYTRTGAGTVVERGEIPQLWSKKEEGKKQEILIPGEKKEVREFDGKRYIFEPAIHGDVAIIRAWKADKAGNCVFRYTTRAFGGLCARAAKLTIVEAENIVEVGEIKAMDIDLPGIYVDRVVSATVDKKIELLTIRDEEADKGNESDSSVGSTESAKSAAWTRRVKIAKRAAKEVSVFWRSSSGTRG